MKNKLALKSSFVALFAAIICVGCFIRIPLGVIPVVLQNGLCILCAVLLGGILGGAPAALFLLAGLISFGLLSTSPVIPAEPAELQCGLAQPAAF